MTIAARHMFLAGVAIAIVVLITSACSTLMGSKPPAAPAPASQGKPLALRDIYRPSRLEGEPEMRVLLEDDTKSIVVTGPQRVAWRGPGVQPADGRLETPITITHKAGVWRLAGPNDDRTIPSNVRTNRGGISDTLSLRSADAELLELDKAALPGDLYLVPNDDDTFDVVEYVNIEAYLPGVIAKELYPGWSLQAFRAQAVAARSYALHERARRRALGSHYDVVSTTQDQAYGGATTHPIAHEAVKDTAGVVLTWGGEILRTYYSSTVGGRAASAADTWPVGEGFEYNAAPPIQATGRGEEDRISPRNRWTVERTTSDIGARLRAFAKDRRSSMRNFADLRTIEAIQRNDYKRPVRYRVTDSKGKSHEMRAEDLRVALNFRAPGVKNVDAKTRVYSSDFMVRVTGDRVVIDGRGFGHGVGMSQFGAESLSRDGWDAERILLYYYNGATIERAY